ncbi:hypothetical protein WR25_01428 [Diploscapter pachys]|uniref:SSD domain-containing protein n=1 Tax=Diploscapter pachys TaxID=2018661 RepID=A0A2A2JP32_9BILA|nr:hypothetical protein WR25_01428 [Diploscapter pachys]
MRIAPELVQHEKALDVPHSSGHVGRWTAALYRKWAYFVGRFAIPIIIVSNVLTLAGTYKILVTPQENDITGYTPYGARARDEWNVMTEFFSKGGNGITEFILILPKNGGNVLDEDVLLETLRVEEIIANNFTMLDRSSGKNESYMEFCYSFCQINEPFVDFAKSYISEKESIEKGLPRNDRIQLTYPISLLYGRNLNIQQHFFGVELYNNSSNGTSLILNSTDMSDVTNLKSAKMISLQFRAERKDSWTTQDVKNYETSITDFFEKNFSSPTIKVLTLSTTYVESEVVRAGMSLLPYLGIGFAIMAVVSTTTTFLSALYMQQVSIHKLSLALVACICPFMACGTGLGGLFFIGVRFGSVLAVTPFLVLSIGVDDAYLMIHAWQRVTQKRRRNPVKDDSATERLAEVLEDTGPAIMISALTNILADCVGTYTGSPEVTLLAYGNMACIFVDFIYQITFYSAVMIIAGTFEMRSEQESLNTKRISCGDEEDSIKSNSDKQKDDTFHDNVKSFFSNFLHKYVALVTNRLFGLICVLIWAIYIGFCVYFITLLEINLTPKKLFSTDSSLIEMDDLRVEYIVPHYTLASVFVGNPGNISDPKRLARLDSFVRDMESLPGAWGNQSTNYFIRDFKKFDKTMKEMENGEEETENNNSSLLNLDNIPDFIEWPEYSYWRGFLRFHKNISSGSIQVDRFFMTFAFRGEQLKEWPARNVMLKQWRSVIDKYNPDLNVSVYSDDGIYLDLIDNIPTDAWQAAAATLGCMALVCFVFMYDFFTVCVATGVIASIMTGILGILSMTGTDLDPIVMAALIISIGFSVDVPAHVSYHYHTAGQHLAPPINAERRLLHCLASVGFPAIQASISTSLCVLSLKFTDVYMSNVFAKTMIVCMILCVIHALLLVPCVFSLIEPIVAKFRRR